MDKGFNAELRKMLREMGYSEKAVEEILKWYAAENSRLDGGFEGIYVLALSVSKSKAIRIGALGKLFFSKGFYAYVGSAQNSLEKRLKRHLSKEAKRRFWHIDYLLADECVAVVKAFVKEADKSEECITAQALGEYGFPIEGFGCSDCGCKSHLSMFSDYNALERACLKLGFKSFRLSCQ